MVSAAHFGISVVPFVRWNFTRKGFYITITLTFGLSMNCSASTLTCVVASNKRVAFTVLTGKTEINGRKLGTKLVAYAQES